jgi:hypothetical protein
MLPLLVAKYVALVLVPAALVQPAMAGNVLPDPALLYETELTLLAETGQSDQLATLSGTIHQGGPFTLRSFCLMIPDEVGGSEVLVASYSWTEAQDEVHVTITAGGETYCFINVLQTKEEVDSFLDRYLELYHRYHGQGVDGGPAAPVKPGETVPDRMMHFFTWLDEQLLIAEDREYGFARKFAWMRSPTYARLIPHAAGLLSQVAYAQEEKVDNAWVKAITVQDLLTVFDYPVKRVLDQEIPIPERDEMESFSLGIVVLESNQPAGGIFDWVWDDYYYCWNQTWSGQDCRSCCFDWYTVATVVCAALAYLNPLDGLACQMTAITCFTYCRIGCGLANPGIGGGWSGGA